MNLQFLLLAVSSLAVASAATSELSIGSADGKSFYMVNPGAKLNWWQAELACCRTGGVLATVESQAQYNVINGQMNAYKTHCASLSSWSQMPQFWTAGKDARYKTYEWIGSNQTVVSYSGKPIRGSEISWYKCITGTFEGGLLEWEEESCSSEGNYCVLCQN